MTKCLFKQVLWVNISNTIVSVTPENFVRIVSVLLPPDHVTLAKISQQALCFLPKNAPYKRDNFVRRAIITEKVNTCLTLYGPLPPPTFYLVKPKILALSSLPPPPKSTNVAL